MPRREGVDIKRLITDHGLDLSSNASTNNQALLFTREAFAAASFRDGATPAALHELRYILAEIDESQKLESGAHIRVPGDQELWNFQKASIEYALRRNNCLIADQPGLGKTPIAIAFANEINARRVLCIVPANIRGQWEKRIRQWTTMRWPYTIYPIFFGRHGVHPSANWTIVSYDLARSPAIGAALAKGTYDLLIVDEGHYLKNADSKRTRAIFGGGLHRDFVPLASRCGYAMALTGTPLPNRPREAFVIAKNLDWNSIDYMTEDDFRFRFNPCEMKEGKRWNTETGAFETYIYKDERTGRHMELQNRLRTSIMTRHLKREVMPQLKMPKYDLVQVTETAMIKQALAAEKMLDIDPDTLAGADAKVLGLFAEVRHAAGVAMADQVADYAEMIIDGGEEKLVIAGWHHDVLDIWERRLKRYGTVRIDGRTSAKNKERYVAKFQANPYTKIVIGNMQSMGIGTDGLQNVCNHILIGEPSPVPGDNEQVVDRLDRGGQAGTVQAEIFVIPNSILERILASALRKLAVTHKSLDAKNPI